jgi:SAM-dependent methyltransferase
MTIDAIQRRNLRCFRWASCQKDTPVLHELERRMSEYYAADHVRGRYEQMCFAARDSQPAVLDAMLSAVMAENPARVLEVGCGSGWILTRLKNRGLSEGVYHGVEMSPSQIEQSQTIFPGAVFQVASGYDLPFADNTFDVVYSNWVLEHCVFPERLLSESIRVLRPGGILLATFPDMVASGIVPSQVIGIRDGTAKQLLRQGAVWSAALSLFDSRIRLRKALCSIHSAVGAFPINLQPRCLYESAVGVPDTDAVYIGSKHEILSWAHGLNHFADLPAGESGQFHATALIRIKKSVP